MGTVLITNALPRMSLAVARSLGKRGISVNLAETTRCTPAMFSKYCTRSLIYPSPSKSEELFFNWLERFLQDNLIDVMFPMDDDIMEIAVRHKDKLQTLTRLILPPAESYLIARDKGSAGEIARRAGIKCPETIIIDNLDILKDLANDLDYPVLIKPRLSSGSRGITLVNEKKDFLETYLNIHSFFPYPLVQKYIAKAQKYGVGVLYNNEHELRVSFVQKEVRHYPVEIGTSVVQEGVYYPELVEQVKALFQHLPWSGIAEVEFLVDEKGQAYFMEINPRFWGSVHNAVLAGIDFPWLWYRLAMDGDIPAVSSYTTGLKCRWLLPGDLLHFISNPKRFQMDPSLLAGKRKLVYDDTLSWEDPGPLLGFALACLRYSLDPQMWRFVLKGDRYAKRANL